MSHFAALQSIVFMIGFVYTFEIRHSRNRLSQLLASIVLMSPDELDLIRKIQLAGEDA
ncbi:MAG TPA: hypothetical protein VMH28_23230 [Candidatus Acidoferrales bacterium]|nr:hypothetical protein [Candidatus Acidoferrales bacterium]